MNDLRFALRQLTKNPGFTLIAVVTLALGIGANTVIFSAINTVLMRPLPYKEPEKLVWLFARYQKLGYERLPPNWANETFSELRERGQSIEQSATLRAKDFILATPSGAEQVRGMRASAGLFNLLGVQPILGRGFAPEENEWGRHRVVLLSYEFWQHRFGGQAGIIGTNLNLIDTETSDRTGKPHDTLEAQSYIVIGILPPRWQFPLGAGDFNFRAGGLNFRRSAEIWEPESLTPDEKQARAQLDLLIARLKPGVTTQQADAELQALYQQIRQPDESIDGIEVLPLTVQVTGGARRALWLLMGATAFVLLIGCVNLANLLLARATARQKEFAIRAALGAGGSRVIRQLLTESLLLSAIGGVLGVLLAFWGVQVLVNFSPANLPRGEELSLDGRVLAFTLGLSVLTGLLFGLAPAIQMARRDLADALRQAERGLSEGLRGRRLRSSLVVSEVALALILLISAGLLIHSFSRLVRVDPGFQPEKVLKVQLSFHNPKFTGDTSARLTEQLLERLDQLPGVQSAAATSWVPIEGGSSRFQAGFGIEGRPPPDPGNVKVANMSFVTHNYFRTMGIPVVKGRDFSPAELLPDGPRPKLVSESFGRKYFPNEDSLGKRLSGVGGRGEIIGVVKDTLESGLDTPPEPHIYHAGVSGLRDVSIILRASNEPSSLASAIRQEILALDKEQPLSGITPLKQILATSVAERRFQMLLLTLFAVVALFLAAVGLYGVMAQMVTQRTHEIGVRMALGARHRDVLRLVIGHGMTLVMAGLVIGIAAAIAVTRLLTHQLFGVRAADPVTYGSVSVLFLTIGLLACWLPARRAARVDPMEALRYE